MFNSTIVVIIATMFDAGQIPSAGPSNGHKQVNVAAQQQRLIRE